MARIEWVKLRLNNWALWAERERSGGLGYNTRSVLLADTSGRDGYRESVVPVDEVDGGLTNTAVESLRLTRSHLYVTLHHIYPGGLGVKETARRMGRAESTIKLSLDEADRALATWFTDRQALQAKQRAGYVAHVGGAVGMARPG